MPQSVGGAAAKRRVEEAVERPDYVLPPAALTLAIIVGAVDWQVGGAQEDADVRSPPCIAQVSAVLRVRLPLIAHQWRVNVAASVHLENMPQLVHHGALGRGRAWMQCEEAVMQLRMGVARNVAHPVDRLLDPRALMSPTRIMRVGMQTALADVYIQFATQPIIRPPRRRVWGHKEIKRRWVAEDLPAMLEPLQKCRCGNSSSE